MRSLNLIANLLGALREGDYSIRGLTRQERQLDGDGHARGQRPRIHAAAPAHRSRRVHGAADARDGGDRRRGVRVRSDTDSCCSSTRPASSCSASRARSWSGMPASALGFDEYLDRRVAPADRSRVRRPARPLRSPARGVLSRRPAASPRRHGRPEPGAARRRAGGVAAHRARAVARDQQLADADQVDRALAAAHRRSRAGVSSGRTKCSRGCR